ncbi:hypothetical protein EFA69_02665 [Rufibacter immobilis]|uniref:Uncharacterized protein n=1 Tax=Rufibacter immobilis TaxID=1348778 RepID=A0A3M9N5H6_9BACT|nr:hypothetical protein [Rufibacter immobilis]RNI32248.1 hypothetical protein EFA69_02665 [Rufibacter immobilis]
MMTEKQLQELEDRHLAGFAGLWKNYTRDKLFRGIKFPLLFSLVFTILFSFFNEDLYTIIKDISSTTLSVIPNLLGFLLGGYAIIIGFGNVELLKSTTRTSENKPVSLFQAMSSIFAFCILAQAGSLILGAVYQLFINVDFESVSWFDTIQPYYRSFNVLWLFLITFALLYSIFLLPVMLINVFNFAQAYHLRLTIERIKEDGNK